MTKGEAETAIRHLCHEWEKDKGVQFGPADHPSFSEFTTWLSRKGYSHYLDFRSRMGALYDAEVWFDQEFNQMWRR